MTASFVLQEFTAGAVRSSAYGRWRAVENDGPYRVQAGTVVVVTEGPKPVGYFHVEEVRQRNCRSKPCILATDVRAARRAGKEGKREMPGWATVDERRSRLYIQSWSAMIRGRVSNDWVRAVSADVTDADLGQLVRKALAESKTNVPVPNFRAMDPSTDPLLVAAGVKTYVGYAGLPGR